MRNDRLTSDNKHYVLSRFEKLRAFFLPGPGLKTPPPLQLIDLTPPQTRKKQKEISMYTKNKKNEIYFRFDPPDRDQIEIAYRRENNGFEYGRCDEFEDDGDDE